MATEVEERQMFALERIADVLETKMHEEREKYARALAAKDEGLDALRAERDALRGEVAALKAADECQVDGVPPCSDKGQPLSEWCRSCLCSQAGVERARADRALKVLRDLAAAYDVNGTAHGVSYRSTSDGAGSAWRAVAELLASEGT